MGSINNVEPGFGYGKLQGIPNDVAKFISDVEDKAKSQLGDRTVPKYDITACRIERHDDGSRTVTMVVAYNPENKTETTAQILDKVKAAVTGSLPGSNWKVKVDNKAEEYTDGLRLVEITLEIPGQ